MDILGVLGAIVAMLTFLFGVYQFAQSQLLGRVLAVSGVMEAFYNKESNRLAMLLVDWDERVVSVPEYFSIGNPEVKTLKHSYERMYLAFAESSREMDPDRGIIEVKKELRDLAIYVDIFDAFFADVERIGFLVESKIIDKRDLELLKFWLEKLFNASYRGKNIFEWYITHYDFKYTIHVHAVLSGKKKRLLGAPTFFPKLNEARGADREGMRKAGDAL
jgi:hypothetical protein